MIGSRCFVVLRETQTLLGIVSFRILRNSKSSIILFNTRDKVDLVYYLLTQTGKFFIHTCDEISNIWKESQIF